MELNLSSSLEDYLEAIYDLSNSEATVRITDISEKLKVEKPSTNMAVKKLKNLKLVLHEKYRDIILTKKGEEEAIRIKTKHDLISRFLKSILGVSKKDAEKDACKIEHAIGNNTFERLAKFIEFLDKSPYFQAEQWLESFEKFIQTGEVNQESRVH